MDEERIKNYIDKDTDCLARYNICIELREIFPFDFIKYESSNKNASNLWISASLREKKNLVSYYVVEYYFENSYHVSREFSISNSDYSHYLSKEDTVIEVLKFVHENISDVSENTIGRFSSLKNFNVEIQFDKMKIKIPLKDSDNKIDAKIIRYTQYGFRYEYELKYNVSSPSIFKNDVLDKFYICCDEKKPYLLNWQIFEAALSCLNNHVFKQTPLNNL